jgi:hypothetical protein
MSSRRRTIRFWKSVLRMFVVYLLLAISVHFILNYDSAIRHLQKDPLEFVLIIIGIAFAAAFSIAYWLRRDPELRKW